MKLEPLQDFIVLEEIKKESKSEIIISEDADLKPTHKAKVISKGPDVVNIGVGDIVLIKEYGFDKLEVDGKEHMLGRQENIYAIIK